MTHSNLQIKAMFSCNMPGLPLYAVQELNASFYFNLPCTIYTYHAKGALKCT